MNYKISREEFTVLAYLHEVAEAYNATSKFGFESVAKATGLTVKDVSKAVSFLTSVGFLGETGESSITFSNINKRYVHLTAYGENYMREVEEQLSDELEKSPGSARKIGLAVAGFAYDTGKAIIVQLFADMVTGHR